MKLPKYDRSKLRAGIFHFGVGGFHRAHQAVVIDNLLEKGLANDWAICGVGVLPIDQRMRDVMREQKGLYTLVVKENTGKFSYRVIGSIIEYLFAPDDVDLVIERLAQPEARIVSLTITEGGYNIDPTTVEFDVNLVRDDINNHTKPKTVYGIIVEALRRRKERGMKGFTIMSCDNLQENGLMARKAFHGFAKAVDPALSEWMEENVTFPNSMVDRITPVTADSDRDTTSEKLGITDSWPVVCEPFSQWILEDSFVAGRPPYEKEHEVVQIVEEVLPYEMMKLRLLNGSHQGTTFFGFLMDQKYIHEVTASKLFVSYLKAYMEEATTTLRPLPGINLDKYKATLIDRFQNPYIRDTIARVGADGSDHMVRFVIPVIKDRLAKGKSIYLSTAVFASFAKCLNEVTENGNFLLVVDRMKDKLDILAKKLQIDATAIRDEHEIFGDVVRNDVFVSTFKEIYDKLGTDGSQKTLNWLVAKA